MQRISRLTPLGAILTLIEERAEPVRPMQVRPTAPDGKTLAADIAADYPPEPLALRDGFAVQAAMVADAGSYAPVPLPGKPVRVGVGMPLPAGADAVLPFDAVTLPDGRVEAIAPVAPGEGVLPAGGDAVPQVPLRRAGDRLRAIDRAVFSLAGIERVSVREPRVAIALGDPQSGPHGRAALAFTIGAVSDAGGRVIDRPLALEAALQDERADAIIAVGGTGSGERDQAVQTLAHYGSVAAYGIAIAPGENTAIGFVGAKPVLLVPGRLDAAIAVWALIGRHLMAKLAGGRVVDRPVPMSLMRKAASTIGLTELIPVRCSGGMAEPLASGYLALTALAHSDGFIVVPADSEGYPEKTQVPVTPWP